jgi:hypothetical protein
MFFTLKPGNYPEISNGTNPVDWNSFRSPNNGGRRVIYVRVSDGITSNSYPLIQGIDRVLPDIISLKD